MRSKTAAAVAALAALVDASWADMSSALAAAASRDIFSTSSSCPSASIWCICSCDCDLHFSVSALSTRPRCFSAVAFFSSARTSFFRTPIWLSAVWSRPLESVALERCVSRTASRSRTFPRRVSRSCSSARTSSLVAFSIASLSASVFCRLSLLSSLTFSRRFDLSVLSSLSKSFSCKHCARCSCSSISFVRCSRSALMPSIRSSHCAL